MSAFHIFFHTARSLLAVALFAAGAGAADAPAVTDAWTRPALARGLPVAAYATIADTTGAGDVLLGIVIAHGQAAIHETVMDGGTMRMRPVTALAIPPRGRIALQPGSAHIMITGLTRLLTPGRPLPLTLQFKNAGDVAIDFEVRKP